VLIGEKPLLQCISLNADLPRKGKTGTIEDKSRKNQNSKKYFKKVGFSNGSTFLLSNL
jgi:hypothetical protein